MTYYVNQNERENPKSGMEMFQSNIYYYVRIKGYIVHAQDSCACARFLCMHKILVHAQHSCACTTPLCLHWAREPRGQAPSQGPGTRPATQKGSGPGPGTGPAALLGPRPGPWPLQCMHKSVVHAQECCACTRILCMHKNLDKQTLVLDQ